MVIYVSDKWLFVYQLEIYDIFNVKCSRKLSEVLRLYLWGCTTF